MNYKSYFKWLEDYYRIDIKGNLQNIISEYFGNNLNVYTDQDLYEQFRKIIQSSKHSKINKYKKYDN